MVITIDAHGYGEQVRANDVFGKGQVHLCEVFEGEVKVVLGCCVLHTFLDVDVVRYVLGELKIHSPLVSDIHILHKVHPLDSIHVVNFKVLLRETHSLD